MANYSVRCLILTRLYSRVSVVVIVLSGCGPPPWYYYCVQEFDTHVGSQVSKQLEPPKKADAEFGYILGEVRWCRVLPCHVHHRG